MDTQICNDPNISGLDVYFIHLCRHYYNGKGENHMKTLFISLYKMVEISLEVEKKFTEEQRNNFRSEASKFVHAVVKIIEDATLDNIKVENATNDTSLAAIQLRKKQKDQITDAFLRFSHGKHSIYDLAKQLEQLKYAEEKQTKAVCYEKMGDILFGLFLSLYFLEFRYVREIGQAGQLYIEFGKKHDKVTLRHKISRQFVEFDLSIFRFFCQTPLERYDDFTGYNNVCDTKKLYVSAKYQFENGGSMKDDQIILPSMIANRVGTKPCQDFPPYDLWKYNETLVHLPSILEDLRNSLNMSKQNRPAPELMAKLKGLTGEGDDFKAFVKALKTRLMKDSKRVIDVTIFILFEFYPFIFSQPADEFPADNRQTLDTYFKNIAAKFVDAKKDPNSVYSKHRQVSATADKDLWIDRFIFIVTEFCRFKLYNKPNKKDSPDGYAGYWAHNKQDFSEFESILIEYSSVEKQKMSQHMKDFSSLTILNQLSELGQKISSYDKDTKPQYFEKAIEDFPKALAQ